ncbi:MAG: ABC transporter ATP-binding protein [Puniceicoccales bacterium]|jgi:peptide/nickel transport system ATP-binding protein|nr:ABC transporter ATP-binding protein [Puniceicoccales bacterium]
MAIVRKPLLSVENLSLSLHGVEILSSINFHIDGGQILALTGPSGSGKSLTALSIAMLHPPDAILRGRIIFDGREMQKLSEKELCSLRGVDISYVFQEPMACFNPSITIGRQVLECMSIHGRCLSKREMRSGVLYWFRELQIPDHERVYCSYPHELSGGMLQRAMLAMALINGPKLLIADEATSALDEKSCHVAICQLLQLQRRLGFAVLFITHDLPLAENIADRIAVIDRGKIVSIDGTNGHGRGI